MIVVWAVAGVIAVFVAWRLTRGRPPATWRSFGIWLVASVPVAALLMEASALQDREPVRWWVLPIAVFMAMPLGYVRFLAFAKAIPPYFGAPTRAPLPAGLMLMSALGVGAIAVLGFAGGGEGSDAMGLAFGVLALTFASFGVGYLVTNQSLATGLRVATVGLRRHGCFADPVDCRR